MFYQWVRQISSDYKEHKNLIMHVDLRLDHHPRLPTLNLFVL